MEDTHIWNLAKSITSKQQLRDLALNILKVTGKTVDSALYNEREIQDAAQKVLQTWYDNQENRQEAYRNLYKALYSNGWKLLAGELKQWVEGTTKPSPLLESKLFSCDSGSGSSSSSHIARLTRIRGICKAKTQNRIKLIL